MAEFFAELKRRQLFRVAAAYAVIAWLLLQIFNNLTPLMRLPEWAGALVLVLLVGGFPITLLAAWARELAPDTSPTTPRGASKLDYVLIGALVLVIGLVSYQQLAPLSGTSTTQQASVAVATPQPQGQTTGISIAVLPFVNLSDDRAQEFFSDGITEEINGALARVADLKVVARTSAFQFKGQNQDVRAVGLALGASHVIEGSVRRAGDRLRISAQLVRAENGLQMWSETYDRNLTDVFAIQEEIAQAIAGALRVPLGLAQGQRLVSARTDDLQSYQQYLRGRALVRARDIASAIDVLEPVVARDPNFAPAWALLSQAYRLAPVFSPITRTAPLEEARVAVQSSLEKGEAAARKAIELDSTNATAYFNLAVIQSASGKWTTAEDLFRRALAFDPNDTDALHDFSSLLQLVGHGKEALRLREQVRTLEPFVPIYNLVTAEIMQVNGQSHASIPILEALPSNVAGGYLRNAWLARAYAAAGRYAESADTILAITGNQVTRRSVEDAARLIRQAPTKVSAPQELPTFLNELNFVYIYIGALDRVWEFSDRALAVRWPLASGVRDIWLPEYAPLRKTEHFKAFMRTAGVVDYWRERGWPDLCRPLGNDDFVCD
jgi:TolB-like protein